MSNILDRLSAVGVVPVIVVDDVPQAELLADALVAGGLPIAEIQLDREDAAARFAEEHGCVLVLKGAQTVVAAPGRAPFTTPLPPNSGMAKGGSGDLLAGITGAFACRYPPLTAAAYACYLLGISAEKAARDKGENSLLASDVPDYIRF